MHTFSLPPWLPIALATALLLLTAPAKSKAPVARSVQWLDSADVTLFKKRLVHRHDVAIRINDSDVARGYSKAGCTGILLVTQLPHSAQGWAAVAPQVDLSGFSKRYLFEGRIYDDIPTLKRLGHWLKGTLPGVFSTRNLVIGLAERGPCQLMQQAIPLLNGMSEGTIEGRLES